MDRDIYRKRVKKVLNLLKKQGENSALLIASAPARRRSRDTYYDYRQDSDFFYLTGSHGKDAAIFISPSLNRPVLVSRKLSDHELLWEGAGPDLEPVAKILDADLVNTPRPGQYVKSILNGVRTLFAGNEPGTISGILSRQIFETPAHERQSLPLILGHSEIIMMQLRMYKDAQEVSAIEKAIDITWKGIQSTFPLIVPGGSEAAVRSKLENTFHIHECVSSFPPIIAAGAAAATLHYQSHSGTLKANQLLLMDCGAEWNLYAGDITRVFPIGKKTNPVLEELYQIVLESQYAAIAKISPGVLIKDVYEAAAKVMLQGLRKLGVLKGTVASLMKEQAFRQYFPHGIGHSLGLDVHDIGNLRGNNSAVLEKGMVFTVEPGLYFPKKTGKVPACGIRIEDDILVTAGGCRNLSSQIPKELDEIRALF